MGKVRFSTFRGVGDSVTIFRVVFYKCIDLLCANQFLQVVKRATQLSGVSNADSAAGAKRSVRDRLGSNADSSVSHRSELNNKRCVLLSPFLSSLW